MTFQHFGRIIQDHFLKKPLAPGMEQVWQMMHDEDAQECLQTLTEEGIVSKIQ